MSVSEVGGRAPYSKWVGKEFVLQQDCFFIAADKFFYVDSPLISKFYPKEVNTAYINYHIDPYTTIVGVARKGARFRIVGCLEERRPEDWFLRWQAKFEDGSLRLETIDISRLTDMVSSKPVFLDGWVIPAN